MLTPSRPPFYLYVMPFKSQERFMIPGRNPPTWKPWCEREGLSRIKKAHYYASILDELKTNSNSLSFSTHQVLLLRLLGDRTRAKVA